MSNTENWGLVLYQISGREQSATVLTICQLFRLLYQISGREQSATLLHPYKIEANCIRSAAGSNPQPASQPAYICSIVSDQRPGAIRNSAQHCQHGRMIVSDQRPGAIRNNNWQLLGNDRIVSDQRPGAIRNRHDWLPISDGLYQISGREQSATLAVHLSQCRLLYQISGREQSATQPRAGIFVDSLYQISGREQSATTTVVSNFPTDCIRSAAGSNPQR